MPRKKTVDPQTKITRSLNQGLLPHLHPDELKVMHFLAQQRDYQWNTGGKTENMSVAGWALLLGIHDRYAMHRALKRLWQHGFITRDDDPSLNRAEDVDGYGRRQREAGTTVTTWTLSRTFVEMAVAYYDEMRGLVISLAAKGKDPAAQIEAWCKDYMPPIPPRPKRPPRSASDRASDRWNLG